MPKNKDFKRRARARMKKTGESYTAARRQLLQHRPHRNGSAGPATANDPTTPDPESFARLARMADAAVEAKTGRDWKRWVEALDAVGAREMSHRDISALLKEKFQTSAWWSQMVAVGYERIRGLRGVGQGRAGGYEANKTKTVRAPLAMLYRAFADARQRGRWLSGEKPTVLTATRDRVIRLGWRDGTRVQVTFIAKGPDRSLVNVQHAKLRDEAARLRMKSFWGERLDALAAMLERGNRRT